MIQFVKTIIVCLCFTIVLCVEPIFAQEQQKSEISNLNFSGTPLSEAIIAIAEETGENVVFDPQLVQGFTVYYRTNGESLSESLKGILQGSNLDYVILSSGTYVIVRSSVEEIQYGSLQGQVVDSETGTPLPNAHVLLADASRGTSTNRGGHFNLHRLMPGSHKLIFSYLGYKPIELSFTIPSGETVEPRIELTPEPVRTYPLIVSAHKPILPRNLNTGDTEMLQQWQPTRSQSPIQLLHLFPGIQRGEAGGTLHLQGSRSGDHRTYLDGSPIYHPYSMGRYTSAFSPYAIDRISVQKAGYGIEHGSHLAGRIDLTHDYSSWNSETAILQIDPLFANAKIQLSDPVEDQWAVMAAVRTTYWGMITDPNLRSSLNDWDFIDPPTLSALQGYSTPVSYQSMDRNRKITNLDLHIAGQLQINPYRSHTTSLYVGSNRLSNQLMNQAINSSAGKLLTQEQYRWNNGMLQHSLNWLLTPRFDLESQWSASWIQSSSTYGLMDQSELEQYESETAQPLEPDTYWSINPVRQQNNRNNLTHLSWRNRLRYAVGESIDLTTGLEMHWIQSQFRFNDFYFRASESDEQMGQTTLMTGVDWSPSSQWSIKSGVRWSWILPDGAIYAEPRFSIQYDQPDAAPGPISYKFSGGLYRQFIHSFDLVNPGPSSLVPDATLWSLDTRSRIPIAWHTAFSIRIEPTPNSVLEFESYLKLQPHGWVTSYHRLMVDPETPRDRIASFASSGSSRAAGIGVQWQQSFFLNRVHVLAGYDWSWSRMQMRQPFNRMLPAPWTIPHQFQFRTIIQPLEGHSLLVAWQAQAGKRWGFRNAYYDLLLPHDITGAGSYRFDTPESDRLPAHHQLDIGWSYRPNFFDQKLEVRLDLLHVLGSRRILDRSLLPFENPEQSTQDNELEYQVVERRQSGFSPTLSIQLQF